MEDDVVAVSSQLVVRHTPLPPHIHTHRLRPPSRPNSEETRIEQQLLLRHHSLLNRRTQTTRIPHTHLTNLNSSLESPQQTPMPHIPDKQPTTLSQ
ncbi:hypothetical protein [Streptomyces sp. NPDC059816]|uniref:hypothetical protein n=1 Tax=Streptomyces sp. NPDC059816 TaxID=3346960 RepID=UPI003663806E